MIKNFFDKHHIDYKENISLKNYNTYRLNTTCNYLVFPSNVEELTIILKQLKENKIKYEIIGNGSNIIFSMSHYDGVIIKLDKLNKVTYDNNIVTCEAGYSLIKLALETIERGLSGLEFAAGIPGCVGASTAMNAGAYNSDISKILKSVQVLTKDYELKTLQNKDLNYSYRDSLIKENKDYIVISSTFELQTGNIDEMKLLVSERKQKRLASQPLNMPSAGSVFRNPKDMYAGELIEKSNLKGYKIGGAEVSQKHANFIVNTGNASGQDIINLIDKIEKEVKKNYNVTLKLEQIIIE